MRLSELQKYLVIQCYENKKGKVDRDEFLKFYENKKTAKPTLQAKIITQSIESLIDREVFLGYGVRTPHKWFIREVGLTKKGEVVARKLLGEQLCLPLK
jgi:hypothetical protein